MKRDATWCVRAFMGLTWLAAVAAGGCGGKPKVLTADLEGRRVNEFAVDGQWLAYAWTPVGGGLGKSPPIHLAARNLRTDAETELEADWGPTRQYALDGARLAYTRGSRTDGGDIVLHDAANGTTTAVAQAKAGALDLAGDWLVWEDYADTESAIVLLNLATGKRKNLSSDRDAAGTYDRHPRIDGNVIAWTRRDPAANEYRLYLYDCQSGKVTRTETAHPYRFRVERARDHVLYVLRVPGGEHSIHLYSIPSGEDRVIARATGFRGEAHISGDTVVYAKAIPRAEFKPIAGQPLINEQDFRHIFRYDTKSGKTSKVASAIFWPANHRPGQMVAKDGRIYVAFSPQGPTGRERLGSERIDIGRW